ncbi:MAG: hypothetical protein ACTSYX_04660 [Candidatus Thorarchaeota archaeon]
MESTDMPSGQAADSLLSQGAGDIAVHTFRVWSRGITTYAAVAAMFLVTYEILKISSMWFLFGELGFTLVPVGTTPLANMDSFRTFVMIVTYSISAMSYRPNLTALAVTLMLVGLPIGAFAIGAMIHITGDISNTTQRRSFWAGVTRARLRLVELTGVFIVTGIIAGVFFVPLAVLSQVVTGAGVSADAALYVLLVPSVTLAVIGLYVLARLLPTMAVATRENLGVLASVRRAWDLTRRNATHVLGSAALVNLVLGLVAFAEIVLVAVLQLAGLVVSTITITIVITIINLLFFSSVHFVYQSLLYKDLTARERLLRKGANEAASDGALW